MKFNLNNIYLYKWGELFYASFDNEIGIEALRKLNFNQEKSLEVTQKEFEEIINHNIKLKSTKPEFEGSYYTHFFKKEDFIINELVRQQRYSLVLTIFSYFEGRLKTICELIENKFDFKIKLNDLNNNENLMRYWNYLEKVLEIETNSLVPYFTPIKQQKIVRNIIAHQEGIVSDNQLKKVNCRNGLTIKKLGGRKQIELEKNLFTTYLLNEIELLLKEILLAIDKRFKEIKTI